MPPDPPAAGAFGARDLPCRVLNSGDGSDVSRESGGEAEEVSRDTCFKLP